MKYLVLAAVIFATLASCAQNETNSNNQTETAIQTKNTDNMEKEEKKKIEGLLSTYQTCLNTSNAKLAQSLYTKDGVFMPTEAPSGIGAEGILKSYEFVFAQIQLNIEFQIEEIQVEGNMAFAITSSKGTVKIHANGMEVPEANRELFVFEKVEGEWKIARYMFNKTEPKG
ncbi:MAG: nuclear transport factor 2 family protein [Taibaiella sp.]|nr:nuclear transport factor 2 family protein [Taibaiella sp.]